MRKKSNKNYCVDCNKLLKTLNSQRCYSCENKRKRKLGIIGSGKLAPGYKNGKYIKKYYCKDCGKEISILSKRCKKCHLKFNKGKNHYKYNSKCHKQHYCITPNCKNKIFSPFLI